MSEPSSERLYGLLPAIYRQRDAAQGEPLRALLAVMEAALRTLEAEVDGLYDNWFVETCAEPVVPYLGDLLGVRGLATEGSLAYSRRALVANTIGYRRRKGIAAILERVAQDVTGWGARAVEFFQLVGATQQVQHRRSGRGATVDVRDRAALDQLGGPFEALAHTIDTRRIAPFAVATGADARQSGARRGKHNVQSVGIFLWRLQSYAVPDGVACAAGAGPPYARYTFHPLGADVQLFNNPQPPTQPTQPAAAVNLPLPISRAALAADLPAGSASFDATALQVQPAASAFYGQGRSLHVIKVGSPVPPSVLLSRDLSAWQAPPAGMLALDPQLGRLAFAAGEEPAQGVTVSYHYGFSADIGGGSYDRRQSLAAPAAETWLATVATPGLGAAPPAGDGQVFATLRQALEAWAVTGNAGLIQIADSGLYDEPLPPIQLPAVGRLTIQAIGGVRPSLRPGGELIVRGGGAAGLTLNGLLLDGGITLSGSLALHLAHCTLLPHGITAGDADPSALRVTITRSIVGQLRLPTQAAGLTVQDSIVDGLAGAAPGAPGYAIAAVGATRPARRRRWPGPLCSGRSLLPS